jgi:glycosyltransferase involved in cell wall biosynthesis
LKQSSVVKRLDNLFTKRANRIAAISNNVKRDMADLGIPDAKIKVIYNGTDIRKFDARAQEKSTFTVSKEAHPFLIGTVGSLTERKGHRYLLEAMPAILKKNSNVHLVVIGEGPEKEMLEKLRAELRLESAITMLGFQENVAPILKQMDVYVHPSVHEPFGIAVLEAMAASKCVVATAVGGVPEIVSPGVTGYLVRAESSGELSSAISAALEERENTLRMGENGRIRVSEMFDIDVTVKGYESLYQEII